MSKMHAQRICHIRVSAIWNAWKCRQKNYDYTTLAVVGWWDEVPEENKNEYINVYDANVNDCDYQVLRNGVVMAKYLTEDGAKAVRDEYIKSSVRGMFRVDDEFTIEQVDLVEILNKLSGYNKYK